MFNENQRKILKNITKRINLYKVSQTYGVGYDYLNSYIRGKYPYTQTMDMKILKMLIDMQDDNFEMIQELSKKG